MSAWSCGHYRLREFTYVELANRAELKLMIELGDVWSGPARREFEARDLPCPACSAQNRRIRRAWLWVGIVAVLVLVAGWRLHD